MSGQRNTRKKKSGKGDDDLKIGKMLLSVLLTLAIILTSSGCSTQPSPESSNEPESAHEAINISENSTYETMLFDTGYVHMIDITISEND